MTDTAGMKDSDWALYLASRLIDIDGDETAKRIISTLIRHKENCKKLEKIVRAYLDTASNPKKFSKLADIDQRARKVLGEL